MESNQSGPNPPSDQPIRVALFNIWELRSEKIETVDSNGRGADPQLLAAAEVIAQVNPDVLVVQEIDHGYASSSTEDASLETPTRRFVELYLDPDLGYDNVFVAPNNTGLLTGIDLDGDGSAATPADQGTRKHGGDAFGYGTYPGEYSMAVISRVPLETEGVRTFQKFLWRDLTGHHMPEEHYNESARAIFRLSSKSHWDLPIEIAGQTVHLLISHPTPPGFDGDEDRNGRRNFDEIKLWADYLDDHPWLIDDAGDAGGLPRDRAFVLLGDLNARPDSAESNYDGVPAIAQLLEHSRVQDTAETLVSQGPHTLAEEGRPIGPPTSTAVFGGGARIDYILPSHDLRVVDGGVFWPTPEEDPEGARAAAAASDHRLLWLDLLPAK